VNEASGKVFENDYE
jgi:hypothetical protein